MKKEYDVSSGERGKFYQRDISIKLPIFIEPENLNIIERVAEKENTDIISVINEFIQKEL